MKDLRRPEHKSVERSTRHDIDGEPLEAVPIGTPGAFPTPTFLSSSSNSPQRTEQSSLVQRHNRSTVAARMMTMQQTVGNGAVQRYVERVNGERAGEQGGSEGEMRLGAGASTLLATPTVSTMPLPARLHAKLQVGDESDPAERAADAFAERVMGSGEPGRLQGEAGQPMAEGSTESPAHPLRRDSEQGASGGRFDAPTSVHNALAQGGRPLEPSIQQHIETRAGMDLSGVRVHTNALAAESARDVGAKAYTVGKDIVFGEGYYQPTTDTGRRLIAHEVGHLGADVVRRELVLNESGPGVFHLRGLATWVQVVNAIGAKLPFGTVKSKLIEANRATTFHSKYEDRDLLLLDGEKIRVNYGSLVVPADVVSAIPWNHPNRAERSLGPGQNARAPRSESEAAEPEQFSPEPPATASGTEATPPPEPVSSPKNEPQVPSSGASQAAPMEMKGKPSPGADLSSLAVVQVNYNSPDSRTEIQTPVGKFTVTMRARVKAKAPLRSMSGSHLKHEFENGSLRAVTASLNTKIEGLFKKVEVSVGGSDIKVKLGSFLDKNVDIYFGSELNDSGTAAYFAGFEMPFAKTPLDAESTAEGLFEGRVTFAPNNPEVEANSVGGIVLAGGALLVGGVVLYPVAKAAVIAVTASEGVVVLGGAAAKTLPALVPALAK